MTRSLGDTWKPAQTQGKRPLVPESVRLPLRTNKVMGHFSSPRHKSVNCPASLVDLGYGLGMVH